MSNRNFFKEDINKIKEKIAESSVTVLDKFAKELMKKAKKTSFLELGNQVYFYYGKNLIAEQKTWDKKDSGKKEKYYENEFYIHFAPDLPHSCDQQELINYLANYLDLPAEFY